MGFGTMMNQTQTLHPEHLHFSWIMMLALKWFIGLLWVVPRLSQIFTRLLSVGIIVLLGVFFPEWKFGTGGYMIYLSGRIAQSNLEIPPLTWFYTCFKIFFSGVTWWATRVETLLKHGRSCRHVARYPKMEWQWRSIKRVDHLLEINNNSYGYDRHALSTEISSSISIIFCSLIWRELFCSPFRQTNPGTQSTHGPWVINRRKWLRELLLQPLCFEMNQ